MSGRARQVGGRDRWVDGREELVGRDEGVAAVGDGQRSGEGRDGTTLLEDGQVRTARRVRYSLWWYEQ